MANRMAAFGAVAAVVLAVAAGGLWWQWEPAEPDTAADEFLPIPPVPPRIAEGEDYDKCLSMLNVDPSGAVTFAEAWSATGGGEGAAHCRALAEIALGEPDRGASLLDKLAASSKAPPAARAVLFG